MSKRKLKRQIPKLPPMSEFKGHLCDEVNQCLGLSRTCIARATALLSLLWGGQAVPAGDEDKGPEMVQYHQADVNAMKATMLDLSKTLLAVRDKFKSIDELNQDATIEWLQKGLSDQGATI